jgi:hypothetical protein
MDLFRGRRGVLVHEQSAQFAKTLQALRAPRPEHSDALECLQIAAGVEVVATLAYLGEFEPNAVSSAM